MKKLWVALILIGSLDAHTAYSANLEMLGGGGWGSSGGGEIIKDGLNPWWLRNVKQIRYCIQADARSISAPVEQLPHSIQRAFNYWKKEFTWVSPLVGGIDSFDKPGVGTQDFILSPCDSKTDLVFQFGWGTLTDEQKRKMPDIKRYLGIVIRTEYDEVNLRGKGFIYINSDLGPHKYTDGENIVDRPWSYLNLLTVIIAHELGHVFGVPHSDRVSGLMYFRYPELALNKETAKYSNELPIENYPSQFFPLNKFYTCSMKISSIVQQFFGFSSNDQCIGYEILENLKSVKISRKKSYLDVDSPETDLGMIEGIEWGVGGLLALNGAVTVHLSPRQKVFDLAEIPSGPLSFLMSRAQFDFIGKKGVYRSLSNPQFTRQLIFTVRSQDHTLVGNLDGSLEEIDSGINYIYMSRH